LNNCKKIKESKGVSMENFDKIKEILVDVLGVKGEDIKAESKFVDDLGADSLDLVELIMAFEDKFGINISDEDAEKIVTVKDALDYINTYSKQ
jgi:acyl carrier protein